MNSGARGKITFESCLSGDNGLLQAIKDPNSRRSVSCRESLPFANSMLILIYLIQLGAFESPAIEGVH